jgi:hypothetical protein
LNTRKVKPTQRRNGCGQVVKEQLFELRHIGATCSDTTSRGRDAAQVMLRDALEGEY